MPHEPRDLRGKKIGVFGKGGAGKSTAVALLARALTRAGYTVCILDADSTNVGLHRALGVEAPRIPLIERFGGMVFSGGRVTCPVDDPSPLPGADLSLSELRDEDCARAEPGLYLFTAGKLGDAGAGAGCDGPIAKIARDVRFHAGGEPLVTLVDFKAGLEDAARGVVVGLDWALVIVDPTHASLVLAAHMRRMVEELRGGCKPATAHLEDPALAMLAESQFRASPLERTLFVLNKVDDAETEVFLRERLADAGIEPVGTIRRRRTLGEAWLTGSAIDDPGAAADADAIVRGMERVAAASRTAPPERELAHRTEG